MKFSNSHHKVIIGYTLTLLITVSALGIAGCQTTTDSFDSPETGGVPNALHVFVYGMVDSIGSGSRNNKVVLVMPNTKPCKESKIINDYYSRQATLGRITKSGTYHTLTAVSTMPSCFTISVVSYDSATSNIVDYDSLLAGPKKIEPTVFEPKMRLRSPFDSVRIDFTVHDSTKRAVQDSTI